MLSKRWPRCNVKSAQEVRTSATDMQMARVCANSAFIRYGTPGTVLSQREDLWQKTCLLGILQRDYVDMEPRPYICVLHNPQFQS